MLRENLRGGRVEFVFPESAFRLSPELEKAYTDYRNRLQELKVAKTSLGTKRGPGLERARISDIEARKEAIKSGSTKKVQSHVEKVEAAIATLETEVGAYELLVDEAERELESVIEEHRAEFIKQLVAEQASLVDDYLAAVEAMTAARARSHEAKMLAWYISQWPDERWKEGSARGVKGFGNIGWAQVVEGLRFDSMEMLPTEALVKQLTALKDAGEGASREARALHRELTMRGVEPQSLALVEDTSEMVPVEGGA